MAQKVFAHRHLRHKCNYIQKPFRNTVLQSLHKALPSNTLHYKACMHFQVLLCTTKLAQRIPSTTLYYKACTNYFSSTTVHYKSCKKSFPLLLCYKACAKHFPVILCCTKLAQSTSKNYLFYKACTKYSQYYFVLQSLHKLLPSTSSTA